MRINNKNLKHILIVGDNDLAFTFARRIRENPYLGFVVSGFLGRHEHFGREIEGSRVIGHFKDIDYILEKNRYDRVVLAIPLKYYYKKHHSEDSSFLVNFFVYLGISLLCILKLFLNMFKKKS